MEGSTIAAMYMKALAKQYDFSLDTPIADLPEKIVDILLYGTKGEKIEIERTNECGTGKYKTEFEGIINNLERRFRETQSNWIKRRNRIVYERYSLRRTAMAERLSPESLVCYGRRYQYQRIL